MPWLVISFPITAATISMPVQRHMTIHLRSFNGTGVTIIVANHHHLPFSYEVEQ